MPYSVEVSPGVLLFFRREGRYGLHLRKTGFNKGMYGAPGGHNEGLEPYEACAIREAQEELGIRLRPENLEFAHFLYRKGHRNGDGQHSLRPNLCFRIEKWKGEIKNPEPEKHGEMEWFDPQKLPRKTVPFVRQVIKKIESGIYYSTYGF